MANREDVIGKCPLAYNLGCAGGTVASFFMGTGETDAAQVLEKLACSFSADTMVATDYSNNAEQPIGSLKIGDHVLSYDPTTGTTGIYTVTAVLIHTDQQIEYLTIDQERLLTTPEHPFYTQERGFTPAGELWQGAHVRKADGSFGVVQAVKVERHPQQMYNLTVAHAHTFFVGI